MSNIIKSIGHGLLAAGVLLIAVHFAGMYLKGSEALRDALDPLALRNYLALAPLVPGAFFLWLSNYIGRRQSRFIRGERVTTFPTFAQQRAPRASLPAKPVSNDAANHRDAINRNA